MDLNWQNQPEAVCVEQVIYIVGSKGAVIFSPDEAMRFHA